MDKSKSTYGIFGIPDGLFAIGLMLFILSYIISDVVFRDRVTLPVFLLRAGAFYPMLLNELWRMKRSGFGLYEFAICFTCVLCACSAVVSERTSLLLIVVVAYFARDVDSRLIIASSFVAIALPLLLVVILSIIGAIDENVVVAGGRLRSSLGFSWPSRAQNYYLTAVTLFFMGKKAISSTSVLISAIIAVFLYICSSARSPFMFCMILLALIAFSSFLAKGFSPFLSWVTRNCFLLCALFSIVIALLYKNDNPVMATLNHLFSNRLQYSHYAVTQYPVTLFGSPIFGSMNEGYFEGFLDNGYLGILYTYGLIPFIILIVGYTAIARFAVLKQSYVFAACVMVIALHGIVESQLIMLQYSPWLICIPSALRYLISTNRQVSAKCHKIYTTI